MQSGLTGPHVQKELKFYVCGDYLNIILIILFLDLCFVHGALQDNGIGAGTWTLS